MESEYTVRGEQRLACFQSLRLRIMQSGSQSRLRIHLNIHHETGSGTGRDPEEKEFGVGKRGALGGRRGRDEAEGGRAGRIDPVYPPA